MMVNAMAASVGFFLQKFPVATLQPGDVLLTNDPWYGTGHLNDFTVITPVFLKDDPVALFAAAPPRVVSSAGPGAWACDAVAGSGGNLVIQENCSQFRQVSRIFKEDRIGHRADEAVKCVITSLDKTESQKTVVPKVSGTIVHARVHCSLTNHLTLLASLVYLVSLQNDGSRLHD